MLNNNYTGGLEINTDVIEKMVSLAAIEVEGVSAVANKAVDLSDIVSTGTYLKPVKVSVRGGAVNIDVYVTVKSGINVKSVAENVQQNVKDRVQDMTGNAITKVNVHIADLADDTTED